MTRKAISPVLVALISLMALSTAYNPLPGRMFSPRAAMADFCIGDDLANFSINFREGNAAGPSTEFLGFLVVISPNPLTFDHTASFTAIDNGLNDDDDDFPIVGHIDIDDVCQTDHAGFPDHYDFAASIAPGSAAADKGCRIPNSTIGRQTITGPEGVVKEVNFVVACGAGLQSAPPRVASGPSPTSGPAGPTPSGTSGEQPGVEVVVAPTILPKIEFDLLATAEEGLLPVGSGSASARARFEFDPATGDLWFFVTVSGVSANLVSHAALHEGARGTNGPVLRNIANKGFTQLEGTVTLTANEVADLLGSNLYLRIGAAPTSSTLVRGQIVVPTSAVLDR